MNPRQILGAAYPRSKRNKGSADLDEPTEGLRIVQSALDRLYTVTARVNPEYFMTDETVTINSGVWALPDKAESVVRVEREADGVEVRVVPFDDRTLFADIGPAVYFAGRGYKSAGNDNDPVADDLHIFYAPGAPVLAIDTDIPETDWPSQRNDLLIDEVAVYLSLKDSRQGEDYPVLRNERNGKALAYIAHLDHVNRNVVRRTGAIPHVVGAVIEDILALLAGNAPAGGE